MNNDNQIVKDLIACGIVGATLGAIITDDNQEGDTIGAMAGAVVFATLKANELAKKTQVPFFIQENFNLYEIDSNGRKHFIRKFEKSSMKLEKHFILK